MQGVKKKAKAGQQRAEDRAEQARSLPRGARPLGMQTHRRTTDQAGALPSPFFVLIYAAHLTSTGSENMVLHASHSQNQSVLYRKGMAGSQNKRPSCSRLIFQSKHRVQKTAK